MDNANTEQDAIAKVIAAEPKEVPYRAPDMSPQPTAQEYLRILDERLSNVGVLLDSHRTRIQNMASAQTWVSLKRAAVSAKRLSDPAAKVEEVKRLEVKAANFRP